MTPEQIAARLTPAQRRALLAMAATNASEELAVYFRTIVATGLIPASEVRRSVRSLARKGIAEYRRALWTEDGEPAGSGYGFTPLGLAVRAVLALTALVAAVAMAMHGWRD